MARGHWLVLLAMSFAFSWQSILAETHQHHASGGASTAAVAVRDGSSQPAHPRAPSDTPDNCPICGELAHAAHYLPPPPIVLDVPMLVVALLAAVATLFVTLQRQRSHDWLSRAPPRPSGI